MARSGKRLDRHARIVRPTFITHEVRRYRDDGRIEIDNNGAERSLRAVVLGRKNYLFYGSDAGGVAPPCTAGRDA